MRPQSFAGLLLKSIRADHVLLCAFACAALLGGSPVLRAQNLQANPAPSTDSPHGAQARRFLSGRTDSSNAANALIRARLQHLGMLAAPRASILSAPWTPVGPMQVVTPRFGNVTGRVTSIAIDPGDPSGNTVYVGTTGGGVWKSTNAAGPAAAVLFAPLTDVLPVFSAGAGSAVIASLSIGAVAVANGVLLAGTGDSNDATDSLYGEGILRSADGGATWTLAQTSSDGVAGAHSFAGLSVAGFAFASATPSLVVAAISQSAEGRLVNAPDSTYSVAGLYWSSDTGTTWHMATLEDGSQTVQTPLPNGGNGQGNAATAVAWNPLRAMFYGGGAIPWLLRVRGWTYMELAWRISPAWL